MEYAEWIVKTLEAAGHQCCYQHRDFKKGGNLTDQIDKAITNSDHTVAVVSNSYMSDSRLWCKAERTAVFACDPAGDNRRLILVCVEPYHLIKGLSGLFASNNALDLSSCTKHAQAKTELLKSISPDENVKLRKTFLYPGLKKNSITNQIDEQSIGSRMSKRFNNIAFLPNRFFTGREMILERIEILLKSGQTQTQRLFVSGMGGVGKSETVRQYVLRHQDDYDCIWWIDAHEEQQILQAYVNLANRKKIIYINGTSKDDIVAAVKQWLQDETSGSWLIVFDNVDSGKTLKRYIPFNQFRQQRHIIVTTQDENLHLLKDIGGEGLTIDVFSLDEAILFLKKRSGLENMVGCKTLAERLGFLPLALEHAAAYICYNKIDYTTYLTLYQKSSIDFLQMEGLDEDEHPVFNTLDISVNLLTKRYGRASYLLLCIFAFMSADNIKISWLNSTDISYFPNELRNYVKNDIKIKKLITELEGFSLIRFEHSQCIVNIHRLLQKVIVYKEQENKKTWTNLCKRILLQQTRVGVCTLTDSQAYFNTICSHIIAVLENDIECNTIESVELKKYLSEGFLDNEQNERALKYCKESLSSAIQLWGERGIQIRELLFLKGRILIQNGMYTEAVSVLKQVLKWENDSLQLADIHNFIGTAYREYGNFEQALIHYKIASRIREENLGQNNLDTAKSYNNIGLIYLYLEKYEKADQFLNLAKDIIVNKLRQGEHEYTAQVYNNLGELYKRRKDFKEALKYQNLAQEIRIKIFGENHSEAANSYNNTGRVYMAMGETEEALDMFQRAAKIYELVKGHDHSYTGIAYLNIAATYLMNNQTNEAVSWAQKSLSIFNKSLAPTHEYIVRAKEIIDLKK